MSDLVPLFQPNSVALIGASSNPKKYGYWTAKSLIENGFDGDVYLVSRSGGELFGHQTYPDITAVPGDVDLAIIAIAPAHILPVMEQCVEKGVKCAIVVSTGFGETGPEGKELERKMLEIARKGNMRVQGPNCMGTYSAAKNMNASIIDLAPGPMSLVLQSGNFGIDINFNAKSRNLGYNCWATIGNQMDMRFHDFVEYVEADDNTKVLLLYMEGLRVESEEDGRKFIEAAQKTAAKLPIAAIKIGRSAAGARAAASHTGSLAGSEKVFDAALRQAGIVRVDSPGQLLDAAEAFSKCKPSKGRRIAVLTDGGGHGVMATDFAEKHNLEAPVLSSATQEQLREILMPHCPIKNPVDLAGTPEADMWVFDRCLDVLLKDPDVDGIIIVGLYGGYADLSEEFRALEMDVAKSMVDKIAAGDKPVVMHSIYWPQHPECLEYISEHGVPVFGDVDAAVRTMGILSQYSDIKKSLKEEADKELPDMPADRKEKAAAILDAVKASGRTNLVETEARNVLRCYGLDIAEDYLATTADEAAEFYGKIGGKVVMKIVSPDILHKTDAGGVALNIDSAEKARETFEQLVRNGRTYKADADIYGVMMTSMLPGGVECIIGSSHDNTFGPTVMFGLGGIFVEILKDVAFRVAPVNMPSCRSMIREIKGLGMLQGARGTKPRDLEALAETVCIISQLVNELREIAEVDLNPVFALEKGLSIADARIILHG
ncbi:acetate--CoA ligase family protein [Pseudodesulfovibrio thermohalotolerans]|uniref:acetate--CoA ligase family protein n=1 Tax=Pseudodesulfovibrio thermohalotolerans TaxID=2880651 RepID=UPI0022B9F567|nr:acetate--CoA ligase family protein [Pseudodesulfovibrio thermohalotolerans]WFS63117.1 acetate--CoA ligase family protein [Pseudodesulfovibrio thermohalotolerans]